MKAASPATRLVDAAIYRDIADADYRQAESATYRVSPRLGTNEPNASARFHLYLRPLVLKKMPAVSEKIDVANLVSSAIRTRVVVGMEIRHGRKADAD